MTKKHMWVSLQYTPVEIEVQEDGSLRIFTGDIADEIARDESLLVCFICGEHLSTDNHDSECTGDGDSKKVDGDLDKSSSPR